MKTEFGIGDLVADRRDREPKVGKVVACKAHADLWFHTVEWPGGHTSNVWEKDLIDVLGVISDYMHPKKG